MPRSRSTTKKINSDLKSAWKLLHQLAEVLSRIDQDVALIGNDSSAGSGRESRPVAGGRGASNRSKTSLASSRAARGLPDTTGDFFARHINKRKQTATQIHQSVLKSLDSEPSKEQMAILRNRLAVWLANAVKSDHIPVGSEGAGKERRYFRT